jgi:hypothetical protein
MDSRRSFGVDACRTMMVRSSADREIALSDVDRNPFIAGIQLGVDIIAMLAGADAGMTRPNVVRIGLSANSRSNTGRMVSHSGSTPLLGVERAA